MGIDNYEHTKATGKNKPITSPRKVAKERNRPLTALETLQNHDFVKRIEQARQAKDTKKHLNIKHLQEEGNAIVHHDCIVHRATYIFTHDYEDFKKGSSIDVTQLNYNDKTVRLDNDEVQVWIPLQVLVK